MMLPRKAPGRAHGARRAQSGVTLVELLVVMAILSIVGTMIVMGWWAASKSMAYSSTSAQGRDDARFLIDRMTREIRDAQVPSSTYVSNAGFAASTPAVVRARPTMITVFTSFNVAGSIPVVSPRLVVYCLYPNGDLWRYADVSGNGINDPVSSTTKWATSVSSLTNAIAAGSPSVANAYETTAGTWEGASKLATDIVNTKVADPASVSGSGTTDLYDYSSYSNLGALQLQSPVLGDQNRSNIIGVQIHVLADLNPGRSPVYMSLQTVAQLRNAR